MPTRSARPVRYLRALTTSPLPTLHELEPRTLFSLLGNTLFPPDNPWNQNISASPVAANSAAIIAAIGANTPVHPDWGVANPADGNSPLFGIPYNVVHGNSVLPTQFFIDNYASESDLIDVPLPNNPIIEGDYQDGPNMNGPGYGENGNQNQRGDSHMIIYDVDNNVVYELYGVTRPTDPTLFPDNNDIESTKQDLFWHAAQESVWNLNTNTFRTLGETSADAAGLSILAGLARPDEALPVSQGGQGVINHALRMTLPASMIDPQYIYPASHEVDTTQGANELPLGSRLRLANTPAIDALINAMPPESQIIAIAMQQYGLIVADIGSAMYVTGTSESMDTNNNPDLTWNLNDIFASNGLRALTAADFQVLNLTPQITSISAKTAAAGTTIAITGNNFMGAAGNLFVYFGNTPATSGNIQDNQHLTITVPPAPAGTTTVHITIHSGINETDTISDNPNANATAPIWGYGISPTTAADLFTYTAAPAVAPIISKISPASGPTSGGTTVIITGKNFTSATNVFFNNTPALHFTVNSPTQITAIAPASPKKQTVDITITHNALRSAKTTADHFAYLLPAPPAILTQPALKIAVHPDHPLSLTFTASGTGPITYQWQRQIKGAWVNATPLNTPHATNFRARTLTFSSFIASDAGLYRLLLTNPGGTTTSKTITLTLLAT